MKARESSTFEIETNGPLFSNQGCLYIQLTRPVMIIQESMSWQKDIHTVLFSNVLSESGRHNEKNSPVETLPNGPFCFPTMYWTDI